MTCNIQPVSTPPFPFDAPPSTIQPTVEETILVVEAPPALQATLALAAESDGATSLYYITSAEPGERETNYDKPIPRVARKFEELSDQEKE